MKRHSAAAVSSVRSRLRPPERGEVAEVNGHDSFRCSICGERSETICCYCTHDACANHLCDRCGRCSDCCTCEMRVSSDEAHNHARGEAPPPANGHLGLP